MTLADEADVFTDTHYRVHIVGIDDGCHIVILGDAREEFVDDERSLWVETRVRFIAEEVFRIHHEGAKANGIDSIGVLFGYGDEPELRDAGATYLVRSVEELAALLRC